MKTTTVRLLSLACAALLTLLPSYGAAAKTAPKAHVRPPVFQLIVRNIAPGQEITDHEWGVVRLEVGVEKGLIATRRMKLQRSPLKIKVDGREVDCAVVGSKTGFEGRKAYAYRTVAIRLGPRPGPKVITILYGRLATRIPVSYNPSGELAFTDLSDHQAVFGANPPTVRWFGAYLAKDSVRVSVNGQEVESETHVPADAPDLLSGRIPTAGIVMPGANRVRIEATDIKGGTVEKEVTFQYYPDNRVPIGDEFVLGLGMEEAKSGPFYDAVIEGASLVKKRQFDLRPGPERMGGQTVVPAGRMVLAAFEAVGPGESTITMRQKQYATDEPMEIGRARIDVYAVPSPLVEAAAVNPFGLQTYTVPDLFTCAIPGAWLKVEDRGKAGDIFGVAAYESEPEDRSTATVSIAFYGSGAGPGGQGAGAYIDGLMRQDQSRNERPLVALAIKTYRDMRRTVFEVLKKPQPEKKAPYVGKLLDMTVAGRKAKVVERDGYFVKNTAFLLTTKVPILERFVVIPAEGGFYVLAFSTPVSEAQKNSGLFAAVTGYFKPLK